MPRVSKYLLNKQIQQEMFQKFWYSVSQLKNAEEVASFFTDLLTETEEIMLSKRFLIAVLILKGKRPVDIARNLHVSYSTIGSVYSWVKNAKPRTKAILDKIIKGQNWEELFDRFEELLDKLPPAYRTDWSKAGKDKWDRKMQRASRRSLR